MEEEKEPFNEEEGGPRRANPVTRVAADIGAIVRAARDANTARNADPLARREVEQAQARRYAARVDELHALADARGVPGDVDVRNVAFRLDCSGPMSEALSEALSWSRAHGPRCPVLRLLLGGPGTGKTVALSHAVLAASGGRYVLAPDVARLNRGFSKDAEVYTALVAVPLLALDELGTEEDPARVVSLLRDRWDAGRVTVGAGNLDPLTVRDRYLTADARLKDRLRRQAERALRVIVTLDALSRRGPRAPSPLAPPVGLI